MEEEKKIENEKSEIENIKTSIKTNKKKPKGFNIFHFNEEIIQGIKNIGYKNPTPIQKKVIPEILSGFNLIAHSRTGSGKTASFLLPILQKLKSHSKIFGTRCLILSPVRDLAFQTGIFLRKLGKFTNLKYCLISGGKNFDEQFEKLAMNPDIIIATPGRILHHIEEGSLQLKKIEIIVIDECDKMMELNFGEQLKNILRNCPSNKQIILLSATIQEKLKIFLKSGIVKEYKIINIEDENKIPEKLKIHLIYCRKEEKIYTLVSLFKKNIIDINKELTIIFVMTKFHCDYIQEILKYWDINSLIIYGSMEQDLRNKNMEEFKKGRIKILIVTDVAARGIDIPFLDNVINFDFPDSENLFIHRVGRTARLGRIGNNFNLISSIELPYFFDIKYTLGKKLILSNEDDNIKKEDTIDNYNTISYGSIPEKVIQEIKDSKSDYLFNSKLDIDELEISMKRAEKKGISFMQKPSKFGIQESKKLLSEFEMKYHPFFKDKYYDEEKMNFLKKLSNYHPKESYFHNVGETSINENIMDEFKKKVDLYKKKKEMEKEKEKILLSKNNTLLNEEEYEKISDNEKENENEEKEIKLLNKKTKRSKIKNFKNLSQYMSETQDKNSKSLWGTEKPLKLDELTLNINTDDTMEKIKKNVWNEKKKTFVTEKFDGFGRKIKNESGKIVKKNNNYHPYKIWKKKNKISIQQVGEIEKEYNLNSAKERLIEKKNLKNKKNDMKSIEQVLKDKKKKFKELQKKNKLFSKRQLRQQQLRNRINLNSKSQTFIKRKVNRKRKKK